jgi:hypothetical protein
VIPLYQQIKPSLLLTEPGEVGEVLALYRLKSLSLDYKAKLKSPCFFLQVTFFLQTIFVSCKEHSYGKVKGKRVIFLTGHIQCQQSLSPRSFVSFCKSLFSCKQSSFYGKADCQNNCNQWEDT